MKELAEKIIRDTEPRKLDGIFIEGLKRDARTLAEYLLTQQESVIPNRPDKEKHKPVVTHIE